MQIDIISYRLSHWLTMIVDLLQAVILGIVQGLTEWPVLGLIATRSKQERGKDIITIGKIYL
jgi:hypothetical protein